MSYEIEFDSNYHILHNGKAEMAGFLEKFKLVISYKPLWEYVWKSYTCENTGSRFVDMPVAPSLREKNRLS